MRTRYIVAGEIFLILVVVVAVYKFYQSRKTPVSNSATNASSTQVSATSQNGAPVQVQSVTLPGNGPSTPLPEPDLNRPYTPPESTPADVQASDKKAVSDAVVQLKSNPNQLDYWLQLALYRKNANDFSGAEEIWLYCVARWPTDPVAYNNLADLYQNYLHEYPKAVAYWDKLMAVQPENISAYVNLAALYNSNLHDPTNAKATIGKGLKANPNNPDLLHFQNQYQ